MKKSLLFLALSILTYQVWANMLIYEPFDYSSGSAIIGQSDIYSPGSPTWARAGAASTSGTVHQVATGSLAGPSGFPATIGNAGNLKGIDYTEYARLTLGSEYTAPGASLYYSLLLNVPSTTGLTTAHSNANANNDGIVAFNNSIGAGTRPNTWAGELAIRLGSVANTFNLGVRASTTAAGTTYFTPDLTPGQTYLIVVGFTFGQTAGMGASGGLSSLWINPSSSTFGADTAPTADGSTVGTFSATATTDHADSLIIGAGIAAGATPNDTYIDEIRVGTTWADVTTVPEPSSLALVGLGALGLAARSRAGRR